MDQAGKYIADAVLGIDTLWGGDVMCPSGTGRFIADSWFSDEPLPEAYTHPAAAQLRAVRRRLRQDIDREAVEEYLRAIEPAPGHRRSAQRGGKDGRAAPALSDRTGGFPGDDVGPGHGGLWQGRSGALCALRGGGDGQAAGTLHAGEEAGTCGRIAGPRRLCRECGRVAGGSRCLAPGARESHGLGARSGRGRDRALRQPQRKKICCRTFPGNWRGCRARTSTSCPSRTPGFPVR